MEKLLFILIIIIFIPSCKTNKEAIIQEQELIGLFNDTTFDDTFDGNESNMILSKISNLEVDRNISSSNEQVTSSINESLSDYTLSEYSIESTTNNEINKGTLSFKIDSIFILDVTSRVEARIINTLDSSSVKTMVEMFQHTTNGLIIKKVIPIGNIMDMKLYSFDNDAFDIQEMTSGNQLVDSGIIAQWIWSIKPISLGKHQLIIKAIIKRNGANIDRIVYDKSIDVVNKPKNRYKFKLVMDSVFIKDDENTVKLIIEKCDTCLNTFKWGNNGVINLEIDNEDKFEITNDNNMFLNKFYQDYKWKINPSKKGKYTYQIILKNDNERIVLKEGTVVVKNSFMNIVDRMLNFWQFLLTFLIIPIIAWIRKKKKEV